MSGPKEPTPEMGAEVRELVAYFLQELSKTTGRRDPQGLVVCGILALSGFVAEGERPAVMRRVLETLSRMEKAGK